jgi:Protein of unknown function (DUF3102)
MRTPDNAEPQHAQDVSTSNSLGDLAARIRTEHEAATAFLKSGLERAINAGNLLIEAKAQLAHGQWLPWLAEHCQLPERTAQAYMRVARSFGKLDEEKRNAVADLSFRDALNSLASTGLILKQLPPESYDRALASVEDHEHAETWRHAVRRIRIEDRRARYSLETPPSMLPSAKGRKIRVARNAAKRQWLLAIGPNISRAALIEKEQAARETASVSQLEEERNKILQYAAALEAEAKAQREDADVINAQISAEIKGAVGPALPFTETFDFEADSETDAELAALSQRELVDRLLAARGTVGNGLEETKRGWWGDMRFTSYAPIVPGPGKGWDGFGSPEWLDELFPNWNADDEERAAKHSAAP